MKLFFACVFLVACFTDTVHASQTGCHISGTISGETQYTEAVGIHSNDWRVVLHLAPIKGDGQYEASEIPFGSYMIGPLASGEFRLKYHPQTGRLISCKKSERFEVNFAIQGTIPLPKNISDAYLERKIFDKQRVKTILERLHAKKAKKPLSKNQAQTVMRILKEELTVEQAARQHQVTTKTIEGWRTQFLGAAQDYLKKLR